MRDMTGQELTLLALKKLAGNSPTRLVTVLRLRELRPNVNDLAAQVRRWRDGDHEPSFDATFRMLAELGAINWDALKTESTVRLGFNDKPHTA